MAVYSLLGSYSTVQILAPTLSRPVLYCTIQTHPSDVIASMPIPENATGVASGNPELTAYADAIEQIMARDEVIGAVGSQEQLPGGLLRDNVVFTVEYVPPGSTGTSITGEATVHSASLNFEDDLIGVTLLESVLGIIGAVYDGLKQTAGG